MALEIADQASETAEPKGATPVTVPSTRSCDAATLNVHGCRTTSDRLSGSASASHAWDLEAGGGRVIDKLRGLRPDQGRRSCGTTRRGPLDMAPRRGSKAAVFLPSIRSSGRETRRARGS